MRSWIWSDHVWHHPQAFLANSPTKILQSNWYYAIKFGPEIDRVQAYDQIPTGSNWSQPANNTHGGGLL